VRISHLHQAIEGGEVGVVGSLLHSIVTDAAAAAGILKIVRVRQESPVRTARQNCPWFDAECQSMKKFVNGTKRHGTPQERHQALRLYQHLLKAKRNDYKQ
jgi:hypothetical protein